MAMGLALVVSADPPALQLFSHALHELSLSTDLCGEAPTAIRLLNRRKFEAVIVDLQLGEQTGLILDEVHHSSSNKTAVTFGISNNDATATAAFRKKSQFVFERPLSAQSIHQNAQVCFRAHPERTETLLSLPNLPARHHPEAKQTGNSLQQHKYQRRGDGFEHAGSVGSRRKRSRPVHAVRSRSASVGRIDDLLVENGSSGSSLRVRVRGTQVRATDVAVTKAGTDTPGIRCRALPKGRTWFQVTR